MKKYFIVNVCLSLGLILWLISGCASNTQYIEPSAVPDNPALNFNPNDLQFIDQKMAQSLVATDIFDPKEKPIVRVTEIRNKTAEHIDTKAITDKVRTALIKSRKIRFVRDKNEGFVEEDQFQEFKDQNDPNGRGAFMDEKSKLKIGRMKGPKFHLFGEIISLTQVSDASKDVYYKMTLNLMNLEQGTLDWAEEKELRKIKERSLFGF